MPLSSEALFRYRYKRWASLDEDRLVTSILFDLKVSLSAARNALSAFCLPQHDFFELLNPITPFQNQESTMVGPSPCSSNRPISLVDSPPRPMIHPEGIELVTSLFSDEHHEPH